MKPTTDQPSTANNIYFVIFTDCGRFVYYVAVLKIKLIFFPFVVF